MENINAKRNVTRPQKILFCLKRRIAHISEIDCGMVMDSLIAESRVNTLLYAIFDEADAGLALDVAQNDAKTEVFISLARVVLMDEIDLHLTTQ